MGPKAQLSRVPDQYLSAYHWINLPVDLSNSKLQNPWELLLQSFDEDDFFVGKLDIDTATVEHELGSGKLIKIVDQFYFEHHICIKEMIPWWGRSISKTSTMKDSLDVFQELRISGVVAHSYV